MLNWGVLIGELEAVENDAFSPKSGEFPHCLHPESEKVGNVKPSNGTGCVSDSPLSPHSPLKNKGGRPDKEKYSPARGVSSDEFSDVKMHAVNPIAVCLLLAYCEDIRADEQESFAAMMALKQSTPAEQVRAWAMLCKESSIDPVQVQQLAMPSDGEGIECRGCIHLTMDKVRQISGRRVFRFVCSKQYAVLELGFAGERVLIAPPECKEYAERHGEPPLL